MSILELVACFAVQIAVLRHETLLSDSLLVSFIGRERRWPLLPRSGLSSWLESRARCEAGSPENRRLIATHLLEILLLLDNE